MEEENFLLILFLVLQIAGGHVGMSLILFTIFSSRQIVRHACFVNFCLTWLLFSVSHVLLLYAGQIDNPNPPNNLCLIQAAMSYGSAPMTSVSSFIFVLHILLVIRGVLNQHLPSRPTWPKTRLFVMLGSPYFVYLTVFFTTLIYGHNHPHQVERSTFNCHIKTRAIAIIPPAMSVVAVVASVIIEIVIAATLRRNWWAFRGDSGRTNGLRLHLLVRALLFTLCAVTALLSCGALLANFQSPAPAIVTACMPMCAFVLFGTQADLLRVWWFGGNDDKASHGPKDIISTPNSV